MMNSNKNIDDIIAKSEENIAELDKMVKDIEDQMKKVCEEINITPEQLKEYINNPDNFSEETWEKMQQKRQEVKDEFKRDIDNITNHSDAIEKLKELRDVAHFMKI